MHDAVCTGIWTDICMFVTLHNKVWSVVCGEANVMHQHSDRLTLINVCDTITQRSIL